MTIALAGGLSGSAHEFANHYLNPLEHIYGNPKGAEEGKPGGRRGETREAWKEAWKAVKQKRQESITLCRLLAPSTMVPSAVGFLAFEYGKEVLQKHEHEE
jgi:hypothetical protein